MIDIVLEIKALTRRFGAFTAGSIKGDVKRKHFPDVLRRGCSSDIQPLFAVALLGAGARFCLSSS
jgi:hypothetical protein